MTYLVPTSKEQNVSLDAVQVQYQHRGEMHRASSAQPLIVACVPDQAEVLASIDKKSWSTQVVKEEYSRLKDYVANAIRKGEKEEALEAIDEYKARTGTINQSVDSDEVSRNLESEVVGLQQSVQETFAGAPAAVAEKQKQQAKKLQYDSYRARRDKQ